MSIISPPPLLSLPLNLHNQLVQYWCCFHMNHEHHQQTTLPLWRFCSTRSPHGQTSTNSSPCLVPWSPDPGNQYEVGLESLLFLRSTQARGQKWRANGHYYVTHYFRRALLFKSAEKTQSESSPLSSVLGYSHSCGNTASSPFFNVTSPGLSLSFLLQFNLTVP